MGLLNVTLEDYTTIEKNDEDNKLIRNELTEIVAILNRHVGAFQDFQLVQMGNEVIKFADQLRRGHVKTRTAYQSIAKVYEKYKALGGNHYVDEE